MKNMLIRALGTTLAVGLALGCSDDPDNGTGGTSADGGAGGTGGTSADGGAGGTGGTSADGGAGGTSADGGAGGGAACIGCGEYFTVPGSTVDQICEGESKAFYDAVMECACAQDCGEKCAGVCAGTDPPSPECQECADVFCGEHLAACGGDPNNGGGA